MTNLNGIVHSHRKTKKVSLQLEMFDVCTTRDTAHIDTIFKFLPHTRVRVPRYSLLLQWSVPLGQRGHVGGSFAYFTRNARCTVTRLTLWYSNTQNDFSSGTAIFSIHTLASPSGRNVNYNEKQLTGEKICIAPSICTGLVNTCPTVLL
jgi:hypothetical protein